jgi:hypothetical protein
VTKASQQDVLAGVRDDGAPAQIALNAMTQR